MMCICGGCGDEAEEKSLLCKACSEAGCDDHGEEPCKARENDGE